MADQLTDDERELLEKHRAAKAKRKRTVTVRGKHDSGADYEFTLDGDDADRVIARHSSLWADEDADDPEADVEDEEEADAEAPAKTAKASKTSAAATRRKSAYFRK
jgi:hypothetical protein